MQQDAIICTRCSVSDYVKAGFVKGVQRYKCKSCGYHFTGKVKGIESDIKRLAVHLFLEGLGYRAIGRIIGVSDVAIAKWITPMKDILTPMRKKQVRVTEMHKLEHFFVTKEMFNNFGWLLIGIEENKDLCLFGSYTSGNCRIDSAEHY